MGGQHEQPWKQILASRPCVVLPSPADEEVKDQK